MLCDQTGVLTVFYSSKDYPATLRRVVIKDEESGKRLTFLTNNFALKPELIAQLYQQRWQVELFFKWIKQHLRIKAFLGTSENAVKTQIWIAVCTYVLIAIVKKHLKRRDKNVLPCVSATLGRSERRLTRRTIMRTIDSPYSENEDGYSHCKRGSRQSVSAYRPGC